ncbi:MAG: glycerol-3-phosphate 1-O-acyltransferase PlsY [Planctomycetota bacterium]|jgi:glycerol-3-phosphate acyltransferase PlsY
MDAIILAGCLLGGYLVGSIPFGFLVGKIFFGVDIREHGSKNLGATNAARVLGKGRKGSTLVFFLVVFFLDAGKGFGPAFLAERLVGPLYGAPAGLFSAAAAVAGHMASIYLKFRGGKGVAVSAGALSALVPWPLCVAAGVWIAAVAATRYISLGSLLAAGALPTAVILWGYDPVLIGACVALGIVVVVKHRSNIVRLVRGTEHRVGGRREDASEQLKSGSGEGEAGTP